MSRSNATSTSPSLNEEHVLRKLDYLNQLLKNQLNISKNKQKLDEYSRKYHLEEFELKWTQSVHYLEEYELRFHHKHDVKQKKKIPFNALFLFEGTELSSCLSSIASPLPNYAPMPSPKNEKNFFELSTGKEVNESEALEQVHYCHQSVLLKLNVEDFEEDVPRTPSPSPSLHSIFLRHSSKSKSTAWINVCVLFQDWCVTEDEFSRLKNNSNESILESTLSNIQSAHRKNGAFKMDVQLCFVKMKMTQTFAELEEELNQEIEESDFVYKWGFERKIQSSGSSNSGQQNEMTHLSVCLGGITAQTSFSKLDQYEFSTNNLTLIAVPYKKNSTAPMADLVFAETEKSLDSQRRTLLYNTRYAIFLELNRIGRESSMRNSEKQMNAVKYVAGYLAEHAKMWSQEDRCYVLALILSQFKKFASASEMFPKGKSEKDENGPFRYLCWVNDLQCYDSTALSTGYYQIVHHFTVWQNKKTPLQNASVLEQECKKQTDTTTTPRMSHT